MMRPLADHLLQRGAKLRGLVGGQLDNEPAAALKRDAHHDATALLGHLERAIARPRLDRRHAASPSLNTHVKRTAADQAPPAMSPANNNRVDPSPYYPVFRRRMVMISYARRPRTGFPPFSSPSENKVCLLSAGEPEGSRAERGPSSTPTPSQRSAIDAVVAGRDL